ncbi:MAG: hypothetical protein M1828_007247 [Chrysothrix sp. TS-e1954]|nr:MAG: hypothetical protein M1828_007247 [Chrysothrix sp. TS-e1954]
MTTNVLPSSATAFDYIIVGGGTAGCVIASRLSSYLPDASVLLIEAGPSDYLDDRVLLLKDWLHLLGGELDYDYGTTEQPRGNSHIRHSRAKVLGGCSSHNTLISFRPFRYDCERWVEAGCAGWGFDTMVRCVDKLRNTIQPVHERHRNQLCRDWVSSASHALDIPILHDFNHHIKKDGQLTEGVGFFSVSYSPDDGRRSSASVAYIHPILRGSERRNNLTILTGAWVSKINVQGDAVRGVDVTTSDGQKRSLVAKRETVLCAGAVDTPRLMLLSGLGPRQQLQSLNIPVVKDIPGVGMNLLDHPETIIMWELNKPVPQEQTTMDSDAGVFLTNELDDASVKAGKGAGIMMHCYQIPFTLNTERLGFDKPIDAFCMTPNIQRPRSRGQVYLTSSDPSIKPALDFKYFTDPEDYDAKTFVAGIRAARKIAEQAPFKDWLKREVAPGPSCQTDDEISKYARSVAHTVYHPAGTTKMGDINKDPNAVVDPFLRVRGLRNVRIADAGIFPEMPSINPMVTVLAIGERTAELIAESAGWSRFQDRARL